MSNGNNNIVPKDEDILLGRGQSTIKHPGNRNLRSLLASRKPAFNKCKKLEKREFARNIVHELQQTSNARFLAEYNKNGEKNGTKISDKVWVLASEDRAVAKVLHRLREREEVPKKKKEGKEVYHEEVGGGTSVPTRSGSTNQLQQHQQSLQATEGISTAPQDQPLPSACKGVRSVSDVSDAQHKVANSLSTSDTQSYSMDNMVQNQHPHQLQQQSETLGLVNVFGCTSIMDDISLSDSLSKSASIDLAVGDIEAELTSFLRDFNDDDEEEETKPAPISFKGGEVDPELTSFLREFGAHYNEDEKEPIESIHKGVHEGILKQWIVRAKARHSPSIVDYIKSGLPIAVKLVECLIEAEKDEMNGEGNPIPLASISIENVLVRSKEVDLLSTREVVDYVTIMSCVGDDVGAGSPVSRLVALGLLLYELFAGEGPPFDSDSSSNIVSVNSINLKSDEGSTIHHPRKKSQRWQHPNSKPILRLKSLGVPQSICSLVGNLLDCSQGDLSSDDAYVSLADVLLDLQLMSNNPTRFLEDLVVNPLPSLIIPNTHYGREEEMKKLEESYQQHINGRCGGIIISGKAGTGKSTLARHVQAIAQGYFLVAKFDQTQDVHPLATVGSLFNSLCGLFARDATDIQLKMVDEELRAALGMQAALMIGILPNLTKLMPSALSMLGHSSCINPSMSMQFIFSELLGVISSHSSHPISLFFDDIHWADPISLLLIGSLILSNERRKAVYFACSYRDNEINRNEAFNQWLSAVSMLSLETIKLDSLDENAVNNLLSDTLCLSPRLTRPLAAVLHHKAGGGNPLFVRQLISQLAQQRYIYIDLKSPKWSWDLEKIREMEISDDVVALLIQELEKLSPGQQQALKMVSCIGSSIKCSIIDILSKDLDLDLQGLLQELSDKGFMASIGSDNNTYSFVHDKIQQAAYELMTEEEQRQNHMRFGLAVCSHTLDATPQNDELFFTSVNQINKGGSEALPNPAQRTMMASLNLKAGKRSVELNDTNTAFKLFKHGISFLSNNSWETDYDLSLNLYDAVSQAACVIDDETAVASYTETLFTRAKSPDDKLNGLFAMTKSLSNRGLHREAVESAFQMLQMLGEQLPLKLNDPQLRADMTNMNRILSSTDDETISLVSETHQKKFNTLMAVYRILGHSFHFIEQSMLASTSLRMIQLTLNHGICSESPVSFAFYGEVLVSIGEVELGNRLGRLALKLVDNGLLMTKAQVYAVVYSSILWQSTPLQAVVDGLTAGGRAGQQSGDAISSFVNDNFSVVTSYATGQCLSDLRSDVRNSITKGIRDKIPYLSQMYQLNVQTTVLMKGMHVLRLETVDTFPGEKKILEAAKLKKNRSTIVANKVHRLIISILFRVFDKKLLMDDDGSLSDVVSQKVVQLRFIFVFGMFFEGLVSFELARRAIPSDEERSHWLAKGELVLRKITHWNEHCSWNFENKMLLLDAERKSIMGEYEEAASLYTRSILSARDHKFVHEEGIASELGGRFLYDRGHTAKSQSYYMNAVKCFRKWGAEAVAKRVEATMQSKFGTDSAQFGSVDGLAFASNEGQSRKREAT